MLGVTEQQWFVGTLLLAPVLQAIAFLIETMSWLVKAEAGPGELGLYVGRSNIFLYFSRVFTLLFAASMVFSLEAGRPVENIVASLCITFLMAGVLHIFLLMKRSRCSVMNILSRILILPQPKFRIESLRPKFFADRLFWMTAFTSIIFCISLAAPIVGAIAMPEYRLSISYIGQVVNFFGTVVILFFVDQKLFGAIDRRTIGKEVLSYAAGRMAGFLIVGSTFVYLGYAA